MLIHSVYFWLTPELTAEQLLAFEDGLKSLEPIETIKRLYIGTPIESDRPVVDSSYTFGLVVEFEDQTGLDAYQFHPIHQAFVVEFSPMWTQIKVYDFER